LKRNNRGALAYRETFWTGRLGIRGKILIYLLILAGFMLSLVWLSQSALLYNLYRRAALSQMSRTAGILVQNIDHEELTDLANQLGEENDLGILLIDASGETLLSAGQVRYTPFQEISREEALAWAQKASEEGKAHVETIPDEDKDRSAESLDRFAGDVSADSGGREERMVYVQQVAFSGGAKGTLLLTMRVTPVRSTRDTMRNQFILIMVAILLATAMVGYTMAGSISDPIIETNQAALELSRARYTRPPHSGGYREIAELNDTLVRTAEAPDDDRGIRGSDAGHSG